MTWKKTCFILVTENGPRARSIFAFYSYKYIMVILHVCKTTDRNRLNHLDTQLMR